MAEGDISLDISPDHMRVQILIPARTSMPASTILDRMMKAGVISGVIEEALRTCELPAEEDRTVLVAQGLPAVLQTDARIEVMVNFALKLSEDADHHIDFREQGRFHEVDAGAVLAKLIPKQTGTPGKTVMGKDIPVGDPRDADLGAIAGEGCAYSSAGAGQIVAERAGMVVRQRNGRLDIMPKVEVPGDLDMHWGNLVTRLPVNIRGDVIAGFSIKSESDVEIKGVIEDARISVKGALICGGILPGKHRVKAHGKVTTKHITGREIKCHDLEVASDIRGTTVYAINDIKAKMVISCKIQCGGSLTCEVLGHPDEMGGAVQVGVNPLGLALWRLAKREHNAIADEVTAAKTLCKRLAVWVKTETDANKRQELALRLKHTLADYETRVKRLSECEKILNNAILRTGNNPNACITVTQGVHAGVEIMIGTEARHVVAKPIGPTVFRLKDNRIVWESKEAAPAD